LGSCYEKENEIIKHMSIVYNNAITGLYLLITILHCR